MWPRSKTLFMNDLLSLAKAVSINVRHKFSKNVQTFDAYTEIYVSYLCCCCCCCCCCRLLIIRSGVSAGTSRLFFRFMLRATSSSSSLDVGKSNSKILLLSTTLAHRSAKDGFSGRCSSLSCLFD